MPDDTRDEEFWARPEAEVLADLMANDYLGWCDFCGEETWHSEDGDCWLCSIEVDPVSTGASVKGSRRT
jgi:hypothetical protein